MLMASAAASADFCKVEVLGVEHCRDQINIAACWEITMHSLALLSRTAVPCDMDTSGCRAAEAHVYPRTLAMCIGSDNLSWESRPPTGCLKEEGCPAAGLLALSGQKCASVFLRHISGQ
ncbi:hypothetical protein AAFF_G00332230 [Aldrovandia affinis]|uniref:Uncharacterized protein n=1 Tax=Aldrovandia affinis TaxID=143900 RepID=A0AAD7SLJ4_9TELE|nr:hypothetical protein AAFF_G00332230 [Aldrovandia affinis]